MSSQSIRDLLEHNARVFGDQVYIVDVETNTYFTYSQTLSIAKALALYIKSQKVQVGDSVAYAMQNGATCALSILGILYGGYRATAINLVSGDNTIAYVLDHSDTKLVLAEKEQLSLLDNAFTNNQKQLPVSTIDLSFLTNLPVSLDSGSDSPRPSSDGLLMYTSGTTGVPKGVLLTHRNLLAGGENTAVAHHLSSNDRALCVLPLYHINGFCVTLMGPLWAASSVVFPRRFSASKFWQWIDIFACSWFSAVPTQISYLLHDDQTYTKSPHIRFGRSASAPLSPDVHRAFESRFDIPVIETMGLTETAAQILSNPMPPATRKVGSPGMAFGIEAMIADSNLKPLPVDTEGELLVKGPNVLKGYYKNPEATSQALSDEGWFRTGDLGRQDENGYVFITGRIKELIIKGGENIAPREIDDVLYQHPAVIEAAAFACPCDNYGQRVEAAVFVDDASGITENILLDLCKSQLGSFKMPDKIHFLDELPKGPSGKIQRLKLVELLV